MRSLAAVFFGSAAVALGQSGAPVNLSISSQFHIGDGFTLSLTTNLPNQSFTPRCSQNGGPLPNCAANFGATDRNGNWSLRGTLTPGSAGAWQEWVVFPGTVQSKTISFTLSP
jgi:hypothetical protein